VAHATVLAGLEDELQTTPAAQGVQDVAPAADEVPEGQVTGTEATEGQ
jgi:hypothetical protein